MAVYRLRDTESGKFWNGNCHNPGFNEKGASWSRQSALTNALSCFLSYKPHYLDAKISKTWEIVEYKTIEYFQNTKNIKEFVFDKMVKSELVKIYWRYGQFYEAMQQRNVIDKIEFLIALAPKEDERFVNFERIKECRAQLRLLGVKTRTYREYCGMFGMMNREQAMRARLTLDVLSIVDLTELRTRIKAQLTE